MTTEQTTTLEPAPIYSTVVAPAYANAEKTAIRCFVKFAALAAPVPFVASATDVEAHGAEIFADLVTGKYGAVAPFAALPMAEVTAALSGAVQAFLDQTAQGFGYDSIASAVTYADEPAVPAFQAQGAAFRAWRSLAWASAIATLASIKAGTTPAPTAAAFVAALPAFVAP